MATMVIKHKTFLLSLLLLLVFVFLVTANAMPIEEVSKFCKETSDVDFCSKFIGTDKSIVAARNLYDLLLIAISQCKIQVTNGAKEINSVRQKFSDPIGKEHFEYCERNYKFASKYIEEALVQGQKEVYAYQAHVSVVVASKYMRECEDNWSKTGFKEKSPLALYNTNVAKLFSIIRKIIDKLYNSGPVVLKS